MRAEEARLAEFRQRLEFARQHGDLRLRRVRANEDDQALEREFGLSAPSQVRVEACTRDHLGVAGGEEGRADQQARAVECNLAAGELEHEERGIDERMGGQRLAERNVERLRGAFADRKRLRKNAAQRAALVGKIRHDDADAHRLARTESGLEPVPGPARGLADFVARIEAANALHIRVVAIRRAGCDGATNARQRFEERLLLAAQYVEAIAHEQRGLRHARIAQHAGDDFGQPRAVGVAGLPGGPLVALRPAQERFGIFVPGDPLCRLEDPPCVGRLPRVACGSRRLRQREQPAAFVRALFRSSEHVLPQGLLLGRRENERKAGRALGIQGIVVSARNECGKRQDVGRIPEIEPPGNLVAVELAHEFLGETQVRRDDGRA